MTQSNHGVRVLCCAALLGAMLVAVAPAQAQTPTPAQTPPPAAVPAPQTAPTDTRAQDTAPSGSGRKHFFIGPDIGVYLPTNSRARDRFGKSWFSFGVGIGSIDSASTKGQIRFDAEVVQTERTHGDNRALIIPVGVSYRIGLTRTNDFTPYVGFSADVYFVSIRSDQDNIQPGLRGAGGGSGFVGVTLKNQGQLEARYNALNHVRGFDLNGLSLKAGYRF